jgi:hypothetical protein
LQHDLAAMRAGAMLDQVDRLPGAQREFAFQHGDVERARRQRGLDMRGYVVGPLGVVGLVNLSVNYTNQDAPKGTPAQVKIGEQTLTSTATDFAKALAAAIKTHGYPDQLSR